MEKERGAKIIAIVALLIAVVGLTVGYAAYSSTLTINGTATVDPASWKVNFGYKTGNSLTGTIKGHATETTAPTLADTTISGFDVTLKAPGDSVTYNFLIKNSGTLNARLANFTMGTLTCAPNEGSNISPEDATKLCGELKYTLTYAGAGGSTITTGEILNPNNSKELELKLEWPSASTLSVSDDVKVTIGTTTFVYEQAE